MKIQEKFNLKSAKLIEVMSPTIHTGPHYELGMQIRFYQPSDQQDRREIVLYMTPDEALDFGLALIDTARRRRRLV